MSCIKIDVRRLSEGFNVSATAAPRIAVSATAAPRIGVGVSAVPRIKVGVEATKRIKVTYGIVCDTSLGNPYLIVEEKVLWLTDFNNYEDIIEVQSNTNWQIEY